MQARLLQRYDKVNIVFAYCAVEVYIHAISATALDGDMTLPLKFRPIVPSRKNHRNAMHARDGVTTRKDGLDKTKFCRTIMGTEQCSYRPKASQHRQWTSWTSAKSPYIFGIYPCAVSGGKETVVCYSMQLHIISTPGTTSCLQEIHSVVQNVLKCRRLFYISYGSVSMLNILLLLMNLPNCNSPSTSPPTGSIPCCSLSNPSLRGSLSLRQGTAFDTQHKHPLQSDYCRLLV